MIGRRMADQLGVKEGDTLTVRFKTAQGAIDARDFLIAKVFHADVPAVDLGQIWVALPTLASMLGMQGEASMIVLGSDGFVADERDTTGFSFKSQDELLADTTALIRQKEQGAMVIYTLLIFVAMISIFDTQVLAVFRRRKEIGLLLALGLTQNFIVGLFTLEGILYGLLAAILGAAAGLPILGWVAKSGITLPQMTEKMGIAASVIYPTFSWQLLGGTFFIVMMILSVVSYLPARGIASMQPTQALRGS
jgi:ABC-type lipoprotein release transport system permease subunit